MGNQLLASKVVISEEEPRLRSVAVQATAVCGAVGVCERGPIGEATLVTSVEEFTNIFGGHIADSDMAAVVSAFFDNGGSQLYVVRTVHYTDINNAATATSTAATVTLSTANLAATSPSVDGTVVGPFDLEPSDTLVVDTDAISPTTATFTATAASRESAAENFALSNGQTLTVSVDGGSVQTVTFLTAEFVSIGAATAEEVAAVINAKLTSAKATVTSAGTKVTITSDKRGTSSGINVTGGTANTALSFATGNIAGTGNVANIDAVTVTEVKTIVELAVTGVTVSNNGGKVRITRNTTGTSATVQVDASSTADDELGLDNAVHTGTNSGALNTLTVAAKYSGAYGNNLKAKISAATSGDSDRFDLQVLDANSIVLESFPNLSMIDTHARYAEIIVNADIDNGGSKLISVTDLDAATVSPNDIPAVGTTALSGGGNGLGSLADTDFNGSATSKTGIRALDLVDNLTLLIVPGRATSSVHNAMITYCETTRGGQVFAILDPPAGNTAAQIITYVKSTAALSELSEYAAIYWPRVKIQNPKKSVYGNADQVTVPPSGHIAGVYSRVDNARPGGIYDPPAGTENGRLFGVLDFETKECTDEAKLDLVFPERINPLTTFKGGPRFIDGARTLKGTGNFPTVAERRGVSFIERSVKFALQSFRHKNNTAALRAAIHRTVFNFLLAQMGFGAFRTTDPDTAFFVDFGEALNPASQANIVTGRVGLATAKPAEFIVLRFSQDTRAAEAAAGAIT